MLMTDQAAGGAGTLGQLVKGLAVYHIRIDRPDGTYIDVSSPSWDEALELAGFTDLTDELRLLLTAARVLDKAYRGGRVVR